MCLVLSGELVERRESGFMELVMDYGQGQEVLDD
jgi:hypothetical protein